MSIVIISAVFALVLAFILGAALGFFNHLFAVPPDPATDRIRELLPGTNCGGCGFAGCDAFAAAVSAGSAGDAVCTAGGPTTAAKIAAVTGISAGDVPQYTVVLACQGSSAHAAAKGAYSGVRSCRGAKIATGGTKLCSWACMGFGDCVSVCKFGALSMGENGLPVVSYAKCTGCGMCVKECPQDVLRLIPSDRKGALALCSNKNPVKRLAAKACAVACTKCGICVRNCPQNCISLATHIPVVDYAKCDSCSVCAEKCPTKVFQILTTNHTNNTNKW